MISPNDIMNKKFDKGLSGYKTDAVDKYLEDIADEISEIVSEKKDLEIKINILAEKLEEYKKDEDSLRVALLSAQRLGDSVIREAKSKADGIVRDATVKAEKITEVTQKQIERERLSLVKLQKEVGTFKSRLMSIYKQHIELINVLPAPIEDEHEHEESVQTETLQDVKEHIENPIVEDIPENTTGDTIKFSIEKDSANIVNEPETEINEQEKIEKPKTESRFGPLKFGEGYALHREN